MREVTLNAAEQKLAIYLAKSREAENRKRGNVRNKQKAPLPPNGDLEGVAGEIAFCRLMNVYPDTFTDRPVYPVGDAKTEIHGVVDVKTTPHKCLIAKLDRTDREKPDTYALMIGTFPTYRYAGYATADKLICQESIKDLGHGPTYVLTQDQLTR